MVMTGSLLFALVFWNRPAVVLSAVVAVRILVPGMAEGFLTPVLHPAMYLLVAHTAVQAVFAWPRFLRALRAPGIVWMLTLLAVVSLMMLDGLNPYGRGLIGTAVVAFQIVLLPVLMFLLIRDEVRHRPSSLGWFVYPLLLVSVFEAVLAIVQVNVERAIFWEDLLSNSWFLRGDQISRAVGTLGHGIQVGTLMSAATVLTVFVRYVWLRFGLIVLFVYATLVAEARAGLVVSLLGAVVVLLVSLVRRPIASAMWGTLAGGALLRVLNSEAGLALQRKFVDDGSSTQLRVIAAEWFLERWPEFSLVGYFGPRNLREDGYLGSSLENGYFIFGVSFGVLCAVLYLLLQLGTLLRAVTPRAGRGRSAALAFAAVAMLVAGVGSSAFMAQGPDGFLFWALCGMAYADARHIRLGPTEPSAASERLSLASGAVPSSQAAPVRP
jgi:hypothetical protein